MAGRLETSAAGARFDGLTSEGARDVRFEDCAEPTIVEPTDAIISLSATCTCGSDLWPYRGIQAARGPVPMGHEYCAMVDEVGRRVTSVKRGQFVIGSFFASNNTCPHCRHRYQTSSAAPKRTHRVCVSRAFHDGSSDAVLGGTQETISMSAVHARIVMALERPGDSQRVCAETSLRRSLVHCQ
jgi:threonine dehydrogenase-like Zn-dependent dehydrogenase